MNKKIKLFIWVIAFAVLLGGAYFAYNNLSQKYSPQTNVPLQTAPPGQSAPPNATPAPKANKKAAADFTMLDAKGNSVKLSDFFGKPIVLNFWASWCPPCKSEMPHFDKVYADVKADVQLIMVDLVDGQRETIEKGKNYVTEQGFAFPVYFDTEQMGAYVYGITSIPTTILIDKEGNIADAFQGAIDEKTLRAAIKKITS